MLLFVDNIFRFTQAGAEVSALLGRIPSAVGYQPTLATDMGMLQVSVIATTAVSASVVLCLVGARHALVLWVDYCRATGIGIHQFYVSQIQRDVSVCG